MQVKLILGANAYANIKTDTANIDVQLSPGRSAHQSLRETAAEWRDKAATILRRVELYEQAADLLERKAQSGHADFFHVPQRRQRNTNGG